MAKLVLKKYPRKPKTSASASVIRGYFAKCAEIDRENSGRKKEHAEQQSLAEKLRRFTPGKSSATGFTKRRKKSAPKKAAKKKTARRRR